MLIYQMIIKTNHSVKLRLKSCYKGYLISLVSINYK